MTRKRMKMRAVEPLPSGRRPSGRLRWMMKMKKGMRKRKKKTRKKSIKMSFKLIRCSLSW
jgi:hypothetical protein